MKKLFSLSLFLTVIFLFSHFLSAIEIIKNGKASSVIVIAENAPCQMKQAAEDLQEILFLMSGAKLPVVTEKHVPAKGGKICIGENLLTKTISYKMPSFQKPAWDIFVKGDILILNGPLFQSERKNFSGKELFLEEKEKALLLSNPAKKTGSGKKVYYDSYGPMNAVSAFLELAGVRFYAPGKEGFFIPRKKDLHFSDMHISKEAAFAVQEYFYTSGKPFNKEMSQFFRFLKSGSALPPAGVLPLSRVLKGKENSFPNYFALDEKGNRYTSLYGGGIPRYTDPSFRKKCVEEIRKIFECDPRLEEILILPPPADDDYIHFPDKEKYDRKQYPVTYQRDIPASFYMYIAENIAKTHPGKKILFRLPNHLLPKKELLDKFPPSLLPVPDATGCMTYANIFYRKNFLSIMEKYFSIHKKEKVFLREYWNEYDITTIPRQGFYFMHALQETRKQQEKSIKGFFMDLPFDPEKNSLAETAQMHYILYVNSQLLWDPHLDLAALQKEYCKNYFGPAAKEMEKFLQEAENVLSSPRSRSLAPINGKLTQEKADLFLALLSAAKKKTPGESIYHKRISQLEKSFQWMKKDLFAEWKKEDKNFYTGEILPQETICDGNISKYKKWYPLTAVSGENVPHQKTEAALSINENRYLSFFAFRCYEKDMEKVRGRAKGRVRDSLLIEKDEHIKVDLYSDRTGHFTILVNSSGAFLDKSNDPETLRNLADSRFWDHFRNRVKVNHFPDRWEVELSMVRRTTAPIIGETNAWKIELSRVSFLSGKKSVQTLSGKEKGYCSLSFRKTDSKGRTYIPRYNTVNIPIAGQGTVEKYTVKKAEKSCNMAADKANWNGRHWNTIQAIPLANNLFTLGKSSSFIPETKCKIQYDDRFLYVFYEVKDQYIRGFFKKDQTGVCSDSCVEIFLRPGGKKGNFYFNFELNCIGTLLLAQVKILPENRVKFFMLPEAELKKIRRRTSLTKVDGEITTPLTWYATLQIPWELLEKYSAFPRPRKGDIWTGNIYKCADWSSHPHWITWKKTPTFHAPQAFGEILFD